MLLSPLSSKGSGCVQQCQQRLCSLHALVFPSVKWGLVILPTSQAVGGGGVGGEEPSKFVSRLMHSKLSMSIITAISYCLLSNRGHLFPFLI